MFYTISKLFTLFLMPFFWLFLSILFGLFAKNDTKRKNALKLAFFILFVFGNSILVSKVMRWWEPKTVELAQLAHFDLGIVLGGSIIDDFKKPFDRVHFDPSADRLLQAFQLYKAGKIDKILITAGFVDIFGNISKRNEATLSKDFLMLAGVPEKDILLETNSKNTHENALFSKQILSNHNLLNKKVLLITSAYHMKRSLACFQKQGINTTPFPACFAQTNVGLLSFYTFVPDENSFALWFDLFHEWYGLAIYKIMGYI